jgi:hypothetical protein
VSAGRSRFPTVSALPLDSQLSTIHPFMGTLDDGGNLDILQRYLSIISIDIRGMQVI